MMRMLANIAGTLAVGGALWLAAFVVAGAEDLLNRARRVRAAGSLPIGKVL